MPRLLVALPRMVAIACAAVVVLCMPARADFLFKGTGPGNIVASIAKSAGATEVVDVTIYPTFIIMFVRDPNEPDEIIGYTFRFGEISKPTRVLLGHGREVEDYAYSLADVKWDVIPKVVRESLSRLNIKDAKPAQVVIQRFSPFGAGPHMRIIVKGAGRSGHVDADLSGRILNVHKG